MTSCKARLTLALSVAVMIMLLSPEVALAHTGDGATAGHILVEVGRWGIGVIASLAVVTAIFWLRAAWIRRHHP